MRTSLVVSFVTQRPAHHERRGPRQAFEWRRLQARAGLQLACVWDAYYIGLTFYALSTSRFSCLFFRSRYMSRILAAWGVLASLFEGYALLRI